MKPANHFAPLWGISEARVNVLCRTGRIPGAEQRIERGHAVWYIPDETQKPANNTPGVKKKEKPSR